MRILKYLILFLKSIKTESECGELRTAIPGLDIPRRWPWLTDGSSGLEILLENADSLVLLDGDIVFDGNRYRHPFEFNSKSQVQPFIPNLKLEKPDPSTGSLFGHGQIPICLSQNDRISMASATSGNNESLCHLAFNSTQSISIDINDGLSCKERFMSQRNKHTT